MSGEVEWWHSNHPSGGDPVGVPEDSVNHARIATPPRPLPVWVSLHFEGSAPPRRIEGFALAWTREHVRVQFLWHKEYFLGSRELWVNAADVQRRTIQPRNNGGESEGGGAL